MRVGSSFTEFKGLELSLPRDQMLAVSSVIGMQVNDGWEWAPYHTVRWACVLPTLSPIRLCIRSCHYTLNFLSGNGHSVNLRREGPLLLTSVGLQAQRDCQRSNSHQGIQSLHLLPSSHDSHDPIPFYLLQH